MAGRRRFRCKTTDPAVAGATKKLRSTDPTYDTGDSTKMDLTDTETPTRTVVETTGSDDDEPAEKYLRAEAFVWDLRPRCCAGERESAGWLVGTWTCGRHEAWGRDETGAAGAGALLFGSLVPCWFLLCCFLLSFLVCLFCVCLFVNHGHTPRATLKSTMGTHCPLTCPSTRPSKV